MLIPAWHRVKVWNWLFSVYYYYFPKDSRRYNNCDFPLLGGMPHCGLMSFLTRPWTSQDISYVIGRKWIGAIKWISAVSEAELFRIFLLRGTHWNSMETLVIWLWARRRRSVTLLLFSIYFFIWLETSSVFIKLVSLSTVYSTEDSHSSTKICKHSTKTMGLIHQSSVLKKKCPHKYTLPQFSRTFWHSQMFS